MRAGHIIGGPARLGSYGASIDNPHLPREQHAKLMDSAGVTEVTGCSYEVVVTHPFAADCHAAASNGPIDLC